jgi:hypothetical protein
MRFLQKNSFVPVRFGQISHLTGTNEIRCWNLRLELL